MYARSVDNRTTEITWVIINCRCRSGEAICESTWFETDGSTLFSAAATEAYRLAGGVDNLESCDVSDEQGKRLFSIR